MNVTFDSNVYRPLVSPATFQNDPDSAHFNVIRQAIKDKKLCGFLGEPVFTFEAIKKLDRKAFFGTYKGDVSISQELTSANKAKLSITIGPSKTHTASNNPYLERHLNDALSLNFKILRVPRIGGLKNVDNKDEYFADDIAFPAAQRQERCGELSRKIEENGCGIAHIKTIASRHGKGKSLFEGIEAAPASESGLIERAIAEWADGDSISAHYAYGNNCFCTRDNAKAAGADSVLSPENRRWLSVEYKLIFVTPKELAEIIHRG